MRTVITTGTFNLITPAHCDFLDRARALGDRLVVFLDNDDRNKQLKREKAVYSFEERYKILSSLKYVDEVVRFSQPSNLTDFMLKTSGTKFIFVKGRDYDISSLDEEVLSVLDKERIPIAFIPLHGKYSTTDLFQRIRDAESAEYYRSLEEINKLCPPPPQIDFVDGPEPEMDDDFSIANFACGSQLDELGKKYNVYRYYPHGCSERYDYDESDEDYRARIKKVMNEDISF